MRYDDAHDLDDTPAAGGWIGGGTGGGLTCACGYTLSWPDGTSDEDRATMRRIFDEHEAACRAVRDDAHELDDVPVRPGVLDRLAALVADVWARLAQPLGRRYGDEFSAGYRAGFRAGHRAGRGEQS